MPLTSCVVNVVDSTQHISALIVQSSVFDSYNLFKINGNHNISISIALNNNEAETSDTKFCLLCPSSLHLVNRTECHQKCNYL